jgi:amidase
MHTVPDAAEVVAVARELGFELRADEAGLYLESLLERLATLEAFVESHTEEARPPLVSAARDAGHRPGLDEDPLRAWAWRCRIEGSSEGLLAGKTVSFKDHVAVAGVPLGFGVRALEDFVPDFDATVVTRVLEAGGTIVGKNTMDGPTGGLGFGGGIGDYERPLNPHAPGHVTGGSSGGCAAAVAAGDVDIAFGGDQGGSIRCPAALTGVVGLKPTFGLVSHFGIGYGADQSVDSTGPMARTVEDAAAALQATAGRDDFDPRQRRDVPPAVDVLGTLDHGVAGLRIGLLAEGFEDADDEVHDAVRAAVDVLAAAGAHVSSVSVPEHGTVGAATAALRTEGARAVFVTGLFGAFAKTYYPPELIAAMNELWATQADALSPFNKLTLIAAEFSRRRFRGRAYARAQNVRPHFIQAYDSALAAHDVLLMPTCPETAPLYEAPATALEAIEDNLANSRIGRAARNTAPFSFTGHPALSVPVGKVGGLPVGMQLVGRFLDDPLLLRVASAYAQSVDWEELVRVGG